MDLSIIIVNWNSKDYLQKCIASILAETQGIKFEIVVIDCASFDGCDRMLQKHYPQVRFIQSQKNIGFAKANNEAFKTSTGRCLLFLNPDTEVEGGAIQNLLHQIEALPHAGVVGGRLLNSDRTIQKTSIRVFPNILNQVLDAEALMRRFPHSRLYGLGPLFEKSVAAIEVEAVSGACLLIKRSVFEQVGMFSSEYFMYSEDIDLCFKVHKAGWKLYYINNSIIIHHGGGSSSQSRVNAFSDVMLLESRRRFFQKTKGRFYSQLFQVVMMAISFCRVVSLGSVWLVFRWWRKSSPLEAALKRWIARLRWALKLENWVRNNQK